MIINKILTIIIVFLIILAIIAMVSTILGFIRLPDEICKLHASGVTGSFAVELILIAGFLFFYKYLNTLEYKLILAIIFILLVSPITAHMISLTSIICKNNAFFKRKNQVDNLIDDIKKFNNKKTN